MSSATTEEDLAANETWADGLDEYEPPVRHNSLRRSLAGRPAARKLRDSDQVLADAARLQRPRRASKTAQAKARNDARLFKDLENTLHVLSIPSSSFNGDLTASPHMPVTYPSSTSLGPLTPSPSNLTDITSLSEPEHLRPSTPRLAEEPAVLPTSKDSAASEREREPERQPAGPEASLAVERSEWHAELAEILHPAGDLARDSLSYTHEKANDLKEALVTLLKQADATWPARDAQLDSLDTSGATAEEIVESLAKFRPDVPQAPDTFAIIVEEVVPELLALAELSCDSLAEGLRSLCNERCSSSEVNNALRTTNRCLSVLCQQSAWLRSLQQQGYVAAELQDQLGGMVQRMGERCEDLVMDLVEAAARTQQMLLSAESLENVSGERMQARVVQARVLSQALWPCMSSFASRVVSAWPATNLALSKAWVELLLNAARGARAMQAHADHLRRTQSWADDYAAPSSAAGVWGTRPHCGGCGGSSPSATSDDLLHAQTWVSGFLGNLLQQAHKATRMMRALDLEDGEADGWGLQPCQLGAELYELALVTLMRVQGMCHSSSSLSKWALELLHDQGWKALEFVRDLDSGPLSQCPTGARHFAALRKATKSMINSVLQLRQLIQRRRGPNPGDTPRPLPRNESFSSFTESTASGFSRPASPPPSRELYRGPSHLDQGASQRTQLSSGTWAELQSSLARSSVRTSSMEAEAQPSRASEGREPSPGVPPAPAAQPATARPPSRLQVISEHGRQGDGAGAAAADLGQVPDFPEGLAQPQGSVRPPSAGRPRSAAPNQQRQQQQQQGSPALAANRQQDSSGSGLANGRHEPQGRQPEGPAQPGQGAAVDGDPLQHLPPFKRALLRGSQQAKGRPAEPAQPATNPQNGASQAVKVPAAVQQRQVAVQTTRHINRLLARSAPGRMDGVAGADPSEESSAAGTPAGAQLAAENAASPEEALLADGGAAAATSLEGSASIAPSTPSAPMASPFTHVADSPFVNQYRPAPSPFGDDLLQVDSFRGADSGLRERQSTAESPSAAHRQPSPARGPPTRSTPGSPEHAAPAALPAQGPVPQQPARANPGSHPALGDGPSHPPGSHQALRGPRARQGSRGLLNHTLPDGPTHISHAERQHHRHRRRSRRPRRLPDQQVLQAAAASGQLSWSSHTDRPPSSNGRQLQNGTTGAALLDWGEDPFWQIPWRSLQPTIVRSCGSGSYADVFEVYFRQAPMAMKVLHLRSDGTTGVSEETLKHFKEEVDLQRNLLHPNIVRFLGASADVPSLGGSATLAIVMELCRLGALQGLIRDAHSVSRMPANLRGGEQPSRLTSQQQRLRGSAGFRLYHSWSLRLKLAQQAAAAIAYMHEANVIHRDVTANNILVTENYEAKVADFNLSRSVMKGTGISNAEINSYFCAAPEKLAGQAYGKPADVFSFGVCLWQLVTLQMPWQQRLPPLDGMDDEVVLVNVPEAAVHRAVLRGERLEFPALDSIEPSCPHTSRVIDLVQRCWEHEPERRPTMTAVGMQLSNIMAAMQRRQTAP